MPRGLLWALAGTLLLVLAGLAIVHWLVFPRIDTWRPWIEQRAHAALGQPVLIGRITARTDRSAPQVTLENVRLLDAQGSPGLVIGRVQASLTLRSLLALELHLASWKLEGVRLDVRRDVHGRIRVAGIEAQAGTGTETQNPALDWVLSQPAIVISGSQVQWTDDRRAAPPLALEDVFLELRSGLRSHEIRLDATPPVDWGSRFSLKGQFERPMMAPRAQWQTWSGQVQADFPRADAGRLRQYVQLPFDLAAGRGAARATLTLARGQWRGLQADVSLRDVRLRFARDLRELQVAALDGGFNAQRRPDGMQVQARGLSLTTAQAQVWRLGDVSLEWQQAQALDGVGAAGPVTGGRLQAEQLDLGVMAQLATRLPLGAAIREQLGSIGPGGVVLGLDARWVGSPDAPQRYQARGRIQRLVLAPRAPALPGSVGRPGVAGADIAFEASETEGHADVQIKSGALHFPGIFEDAAIPVGSLDARLQWRITARAGAAPAVALHLREVRFANEDVAGELEASWQTGAAADASSRHGPGAYLPGVIDLTGHIRQARADRVHAYLPLHLPGSVRHWVRRAIRGGTLSDGAFAVKGDVWNIPFSREPGTFRVTGKLEGARFDYLPTVPPGEAEPAWTSPWPGFEDVSGHLIFDRQALRIDQMQGKLWGVQLQQVRARVDDLSHDAVLQVDGGGRGPVVDVLRFIDESPVGGWLKGGLAGMSASGTGQLELGLTIPLARPEASRVRGTVTLPGNDVQISPDLPVLVGAQARIAFTERDFRITQARAQALGGAMTLEGGTESDGRIRLRMQGQATDAGLRQATHWAPLPLIAQRLSGQTSWQAEAWLGPKGPDVTVTTDLIGLRSDWPAPMAKPAAARWPLRWRMQPAPDAPSDAATPSAAGRGTAAAAAPVVLGRPVVAGASPSPLPSPAQRWLWSLDVADRLRMRLSSEYANGQAATRWRGGTVSIQGEPAPTEEGENAPGLRIGARFDTLDADAWTRALPESAGGLALPLGWPSIQLAMRADVLKVMGRGFRSVGLMARQDAAQQPTVWDARVRADELAGRVQWRMPAQLGDPGSLEVALQRLVIPAAWDSAASVVEAPRTAASHLPRTGHPLPAMKVDIDELVVRERLIGRLNLLAEAREGSRTDWQLKRLAVFAPGAQLEAKGVWSPALVAGVDGRMALDVRLDLQDGGRLAQHFGWQDAVRGTRGDISGQLQWEGSPLVPHGPSITGALQVSLSDGQLLRAEPGGLGRLLGILSLQALPRRLLLDFRDVFQEGFAFDQIEGQVRIAGGVARTRNLRMGGVQASVLVEGEADLLRETQDLRIVIVPEVNAGTASLAYLAVNPAVGLGTFLAQLLLRDPLRAAGTREFKVSGSMAEPKVEAVMPTSSPPGSASGPASGSSAPVLAPATRSP
jgi:uncharacterized protein YhdP